MCVNFENELYLPVFKGESAQSYLMQKGQWLLANVEGCPWPKEVYLVVYEREKILLLPPADGYYAAVAINVQQTSFLGDMTYGKKFIMQFLSALSWVCNSGVKVVSWADYNGFTNFSNNMRLTYGFSTCGVVLVEHFRPTYLPLPKNKNIRLALALYREGMSLNHQGYAFLSLFKIINLKYKNGLEQKKWIKNNISKIENKDVQRRIDEIRTKEGCDPSEYLYCSCRCAVAHASVDRIMYDPENLDDELRLYRDYPVILHLVRILLEEEYGVKTLGTIFREHKYELGGFSEILEEKIMNDLKQGLTIARRSIQFKDTISIRLWNKPKFGALENLYPKVIHAFNGKVEMYLKDDCDVLCFCVILDFPSEKLIFEPFYRVNIQDNGSVAAAQRIADYYKFLGELILNGVLELWSYQTNKILGRHNEYIPLNVLPGQSHDNLEQESLRYSQESKKRADRKLAENKVDEITE